MTKWKALSAFVLLSLFGLRAFTESEMETFQNRLNVADSGREVQVILNEVIKKGFRSQEITAIGKRMEAIVSRWAKGGEGSRSIFLSNSDPTHEKRVQKVLNGDIFMPIASVDRTMDMDGKKFINPQTKKPEIRKFVEPRLVWIEDLKVVQYFLKRFAPNSASLKKAWNEVVAADFMIQAILTGANKMQRKPMKSKIKFFEGFQEKGPKGESSFATLRAMRESLQKEIKTVEGVRMWFYDTKASQALMLATIPAIIAGIDGVLKGYDVLNEDFQKLQATSRGGRKPEAQEEQSLSREEQEKIERESAAVLQASKKAYNQRDKEVMLEYGNYFITGADGRPYMVQPSWMLPSDYNYNADVKAKIDARRKAVEEALKEMIKVLMQLEKLEKSGEITPDQEKELAEVRKQLAEEWPRE